MEKPRSTAPSPLGSPPSLADRALDSALQQFRKYGHHPSPEHVKGLREIAANIEAQVNGTADKCFYLSSLPTGMGKTTVVIETVKALVSDPANSDVGVVIFVNQLKLIPELIGRIGLQDHQFAVRTGKDNEELNNLGVGMPTKENPRPHTSAQVLFTTQQKLTQLSQHQKNFEKNPLFEYRGKTRQARIWDEAIIPIDPITLTVAEILQLRTKLERTTARLAAEVEQWASDLPKIPDGSVSRVPSLTEMPWPELSQLEALAKEDPTAWAFMRMSGQRVRVHQDDYSGTTTISYREVLPTEFAPLLVLDASGNLRAAYQAWSNGRGDLVQLYSPGKTYRNLTVRHWDHASGKAAHRVKRTRDDLVDGAVSAFCEVPAGEPVLFIVRKPEKPHQDMKELIRAEVAKRGGEESQLHFLTWGRHTAANDYGHIKHVIVIGALQTPYAHYIALLRGSGKMPIDLETKREQVEDIRMSEIMHEIFQAVGRGAVRTSVDGDCPEGCKLWIVYSTSGPKGIPCALLDRTFPKATVEDWEPLPASLRGGSLKTDNRERFVAALETTGGEWFEARDFEPKFSKPMAWRFLNDEAVLKYLAANGWQLETAKGEKRRGGQAHRYRLVPIAAIDREAA